MKALSIKNPWATLIVNGLKEYEFRSWQTKYRGKIYIHASKSFKKEEVMKFSIYNFKYINGAIIGEATLTDCIKVTPEFILKLERVNPLVYKKNNYNSLYAWKLEDIKMYKEPIYVKGSLGLWNYEKSN